jgi:hypothetical protein
VSDATLFCEEIEKNGFATCEAVVSAAEVEQLRAAINRINEQAGVRKKIGVFAVRNLLEESPEVRELACSPAIRRGMDRVRSIDEPLPETSKREHLRQIVGPNRVFSCFEGGGRPPLMVRHHLDLQGRPSVSKDSLLLDENDEELLIGHNLLTVRHRHDELASGDRVADALDGDAGLLLQLTDCCFGEGLAWL